MNALKVTFVVSLFALAIAPSVYAKSGSDYDSYSRLNEVVKSQVQVKDNALAIETNAATTLNGFEAVAQSLKGVEDRIDYERNVTTKGFEATNLTLTTNNAKLSGQLIETQNHELETRGMVETNKADVTLSHGLIATNMTDIDHNADGVAKNAVGVKKNADDIVDLRASFEQQAKKLNGVMASNQAVTAAHPYLDHGQVSSVGVGIGAADGEGALSVGYAQRLSSNWVLDGNVATTSAHDTSVGVGASYAW
ncbi:YadA C-terminal domain-containing protein [Vibrio lamellibrachiae]|uniref:YadA C-terminal domain-containing protein n=1 Tax=Vibrio lamellibrachiae TaxID=2910253 RepID=UPI003D0A5AFE